jgi:ABC-type Na+ efflux pump permease subunit
MPDEKPHGKRPWPFILITIVLVLLATLNYLTGSPIQTWLAGILHIDQPLIGVAVFFLLLAVLPMIFLVTSGGDKPRK